MAQLIDELRPNVWEDVAGQDENVNIFKAIIKNPEKSPKVIILHGATGTGKTTCARIFARVLNNMSEQEFENSHYSVFDELDTSDFKSSGGMKEQLFTLSMHDNVWRVIFFDEIHAANEKMQTGLLKAFEELPEKLFVIMATTDINRVLNELRSRALEIFFAPVSYDDIISHLDKLEEKLNITIEQDVKESIAYSCRGHVRNAHHLLNQYLLQSKDIFLLSLNTNIEYYCDFFCAAYKSNQNTAIGCVNKLMGRPLPELQEDFDEFIVKCSFETLGRSSNSSKIKEVADLYGEKFSIIVDTYFQSWVLRMFESNTLFSLSMANFYKIIRSGI